MAKRMSKAARKKRRTRVILILIIVLAILAAAVIYLRKRVTSEVNAGNDTALSATVSRGSISTNVSGSGNLTDEDVEELSLYGSIEIDEILVEAGDAVEEGQVLARVNMSTVLSAMSEVQTQLNELDEEIGEASGQELADSISTALPGRVMKLYAAEGDDVTTVMYEHGALALLSLDGYLAVELETQTLSSGDAVTVTCSDGTTVEGSVESAGDGIAVILFSDSEAAYGDTVSVTDSEGTALGSGVLFIHREMKITGIAGTVEELEVAEGDAVAAEDTILTLTDTSFSANYTSLLEERQALEEELQELITIYQDGAVLAPISGTISSVGDEESSTSQQSSYSAFGSTQTAATAAEQTLLSICPGTKMTVSISVDETDILSLAVGQTATVSVDALEETVEGTVTEIDTTATSSGGVTVYTVTVTFDKTENMLSGMSASVSIVIEGVEDALLIPAEALTQTSASSYVYTTYDSETGELGGITEVTTGLNNGSYVEINGGLAEGDTVYYFEKEDDRFDFGGFGGGEMPGGFGGGGEMPGGFGGGGEMPGGFGGGGEMPGGRGFGG